MTPSTLKNYTCKDLAQMAKKQGVRGWHAMRKEELVKALSLVKKRKTLRGQSATAKNNKQSQRSVVNGSLNGKNTKASESSSKTSPAVLRKINSLHKKLEIAKNLGKRKLKDDLETDRIVVMVRDPYWLHAFWEVSQKSVDRAKAALSQSWHSAKPVLRLFAVEDGGSAKVIKIIEIHGGVNNWYIDVENPPCDYRLEIGYRTPDGYFYCLARSNTVSTPSPNTSDSVDENWTDVAENADRIFAMSGGYSPKGTSLELQELLENRLGRPMGSPMETRFGNGALTKESNELEFAIDAELVVYGVSQRDSHVTLNGEPVQLRPDGTFTVRLNLSDRREVIPVVASSANGYIQRTIILAVERNTKVMEPVYRDLKDRL